MKSDWESCLLGDLIEINQNNIGKNHAFENICYVDISSVGSGTISYENVIKLSDAPSRAKRLAVNGDTIISTVRPGNRSFAFLKKCPINSVYSTGFAVLHPYQDRINPRFLYYTVSDYSFTGYLTSVEKGTSYPSIDTNDIKSAQILIPNIKNQNKIASILSAYDDLIENNLKRIKLLEEKAQLTYEEWFVRMKYPGHENDNVDSETGLPEGWKKVSLGSIIKNYDSKRIPLSKVQREKIPGNFPYYGASSIMDYINDYLFDGRYVLMGEDGTVQTKDGYPMLQFVEGKFWVNNHAHVLEGVGVSQEFLFLFLSRYKISGHVTGVAQPKINQKNLNRIPLILATDKRLSAFDSVVRPIFNCVFNLKSQNISLISARDLLLPRLMSDMIDIDEIKYNYPKEILE